MCVAKSELEMLLEHPNICSSPLPIIFFANKMDVPGALSPVECSQQLELERISERPWHITLTHYQSIPLSSLSYILDRPSNAITGMLSLRVPGV